MVSVHNSKVFTLHCIVFQSQEPISFTVEISHSLLSPLSTDAAIVWTPHWYWTLKLSLSPHEFHALTTAAAVSCTFLDTATTGSLAASLDLFHHTHQGMEETRNILCLDWQGEESHILVP